MVESSNAVDSERAANVIRQAKEKYYPLLKSSQLRYLLDIVVQSKAPDMPSRKIGNKSLYIESKAMKFMIEDASTNIKTTFYHPMTSGVHRIFYPGGPGLVSVGPLT
jgi:hypothetical protein